MVCTKAADCGPCLPAVVGHVGVFYQLLPNCLRSFATLFSKISPSSVVVEEKGASWYAVWSA